MTRTIATLLAACSLAAAGAASAETARIQHGDLDLNTSAGAHAFAARVETATRDVCRAPSVRLSERSTCERIVRAEVIKQLPKHAQVRYALNRM
ncbi:hypothetical protein BH10PSE1_BH10PSE1_14270 [soil metagenome]